MSLDTVLDTSIGMETCTQDESDAFFLGFEYLDGSRRHGNSAGDFEICHSGGVRLARG